MRLADLLTPSAVIAELRGSDVAAVLTELCGPLSEESIFRAEALAAALAEREKLGSTAIGGGVAIPHARVPNYPRLRASFGRSVAGVEFQARDKAPVHFLVALVAPAAATGPHVTALSRISRLFRRESVLTALHAAAAADEIYRILIEEDARNG